MQSCTNEFQKDTTEAVAYVTDDITTLVVPNSHDLRPITLQNTNIILSEESRADTVKIKIFKIENNTYKLLFDGVIDRDKSINSVVKVPNNTSLLSVQADLVLGTREWIVTPSELENLIIEDEAVTDTDTSGKSSTSAKSSAVAPAADPPTWNCGDYAELSGNQSGNFKISTNSTQSLTVSQNTKIYICSGSSWNPSSFSDWGGKLTIYLTSGASLSLNGALYSTIYNEGTFNGVNTIFRNNSEFNNWGLRILLEILLSFLMK